MIEISAAAAEWTLCWACFADCCFQGQGGTINHKICWVLYSHVWFLPLFLCLACQPQTHTRVFWWPDLIRPQTQHTASFSDWVVHNRKTVRRGPTCVSHCIDRVSKNSINSEEGHPGGRTIDWVEKYCCSLTEVRMDFKRLSTASLVFCPQINSDLCPSGCAYNTHSPSNRSVFTTHWRSLTPTAPSGCYNVVDMQPLTSSCVINLTFTPPVFIKILLLAIRWDFPGRRNKALALHADINITCQWIMNKWSSSCVFTFADLRLSVCMVQYKVVVSTFWALQWNQSNSSFINKKNIM